VSVPSAEFRIDFESE